MNRDSSNFGDFLGYTYPRKTPNFGDASGIRNFGDILGTGSIQILRIYCDLSPKNLKFRGWGRGYSSKNVWGCFGDGETLNFGDIWGKIPENPQFLGWGQGRESRGFLPH